MQHCHQYNCNSETVRNKDFGLGFNKQSQFRTANQKLFLQKNNLSILNSQILHKQLQTKKIMRSSLKRLIEELKETEEIWLQRESESIKYDQFQVKKRKQIDTIVAMVIYVLLFTFALLIAPNQFYNPKQ